MPINSMRYAKITTRMTNEAVPLHAHRMSNLPPQGGPVVVGMVVALGVFVLCVHAVALWRALCRPRTGGYTQI